MPESVLNLQGELSADEWLRLDDDAAMVADRKQLVSLARWQADKAQLLASGASIGVYLDNTVDVETLADDVSHWSLIALNFPSFADGRAYSQARLLRERLAYRGSIRACGEVLRDQLFYMSRCGFDSFELALAADPEQARQALNEFSVAYQQTAARRELRKAG